MNRSEFDAFCATLKAVTNVEQWGNASVWKVGGKIFAICSHWGPGEHDKISFKCSDLSYVMLCEQPGIIPAPYLARAKWVQVESPEGLQDDEIRTYIEGAHALIVKKLTNSLRRELGLDSA